MLVDFWTYTCINCIRTLPYLKAWDAAYRNDGLTIVGVETPEFAFEHDASNVANAIEQFGLRYPVVQDNNMGTWNAYGNEYWPADYLIDAHGQVCATRPSARATTAQTETAIRALLAEAGYQVGAKSHPTGVIVPSEEATPETYLGTARAQGWVNGPEPGLHDYGPPPTGELAVNDFAYSGTWNIAGQPAVAVSGRRDRRGVRGQERLPRAELARRTPAARAGAARRSPDPSATTPAPTCTTACVTVRRQRLYTLVSLPRDERHRLSLRFAPGVTGYAFTFG